MDWQVIAGLRIQSLAGKVSRVGTHLWLQPGLIAGKQSTATSRQLWVVMYHPLPSVRQTFNRLTAAVPVPHPSCHGPLRRAFRQRVRFARKVTSDQLGGPSAHRHAARRHPGSDGTRGRGAPSAVRRNAPCLAAQEQGPALSAWRSAVLRGLTLAMTSSGRNSSGSNWNRILN